MRAAFVLFALMPWRACLRGSAAKVVHKAKDDYRQHSYQFKHKRRHRHHRWCVLYEQAKANVPAIRFW
jgi:hypothetical protein